MPLDVTDSMVRERYGRIVLAGARLEQNVAGLLVLLQTPREEPSGRARRVNARMTLSKVIEWCHVCLEIRLDDGAIPADIGERLRMTLERADQARVARIRLVHASTVVVDESSPEVQGSITFAGDHAVVVCLDELDNAGRDIEAAASDIILAKSVVEYQLGPRA